MNSCNSHQCNSSGCANTNLTSKLRSRNPFLSLWFGVWRHRTRCWHFLKERVERLCRRSVIRYRVRPKLLRHCGHSRQQNPPAIQSAQESIPSAPVADSFSAWHCAPARHSRQRTTRTGHRPDSSKLRQGRKFQGTNSESLRTIDASTQGSSNNATLCTNWFSLAARFRRRSQTSHTILTEADWCAIRAAARRELGLPPVIKTTETEARVYW